MSETASTVGASPSWTWAKLRMRFARYTSAIPTATSAPSNPMVTPCSITPRGNGKNTIWKASTARAGTSVAATRRSRPVVSVAPTRVNPPLHR